MLLAEVAAASAAVGATRSRTAKLGLLADVLRAAAAAEVALVAAYLSGELPQRRTGVGWRSLQQRPDPATDPTLTVIATDERIAALAALSGPGSSSARQAPLAELLGLATADEQRLLVGLLSGELRQGAQTGLVTDAVARAAGVPLAAVRRAVLLCGSLPEVATTALTGGGLSAYSLVVGRPLSPMLASPARGLAEALAGERAVEWKLDGIRVQAHRDGDEVGVFTRSLDDITERVPELVAAVRALPVTAVVLDGEALALDGDERPLPFQVTASRTASREGVALTAFWFDVLHVDGTDLLDAPLAERVAVLDRLVPRPAPRLVTADLAAAEAFAADAVARGHEGVVVKDLTASYDAGRRGSAWQKVKPRHTLDLVVLAVEHGSGRRRGWLSNLHLGARDGDGFVMLGKTFKGLTDELLRWQIERFRELEVSDDGGVVTVRPEQVVEVAFDGVQTSPRYPGGVALRFARVLRYRDDKPAAEADTLDAVRDLLP
ncbi:MAG: ATP-dependent DNA ligase [Mycobacteriales bacterium]|nr:ATP-dependent DNA ligase [Mycobacteriales bacterium]